MNKERLDKRQDLLITKELILKCPLWKLVKCPIKKIELTKENMFKRSTTGTTGTIGTTPTKGTINNRK